jgi:hypothetical protein
MILENSFVPHHFMGLLANTVEALISKAGQYTMNKEDFQEYMNRWTLVADVKKREIRNASFELMLKQTFAVWDIGRSLRFFNQDELPNPLWSQLQIKWKERLA